MTAEAARAAVEKFLSENDVDDRASAALRNATPEVQMQAMERGSLSVPSRALFSSYLGPKKGRNALKHINFHGFFMDFSRIFISFVGFPWVSWVFEDCKNPSAALMVRINGSAGHSHSSGLNAADLKGTPEEVWAKIMAKNNPQGQKSRFRRRS